MSETLHPSHKTRISMDASSFDEICTVCGATDHAGGGWGRLALPCSGPRENAMSETKEVAGLDPDALEAARLAAIASWHSDDMSFETALERAIQAYLPTALEAKDREIERLTAERDAVDAQMAAQNRILSQVWGILDRSKGENLIERVSTLTRQLEEAREALELASNKFAFADGLSDPINKSAFLQGARTFCDAAIRSLKQGERDA